MLMRVATQVPLFYYVILETRHARCAYIFGLRDAWYAMRFMT